MGGSDSTQTTQSQSVQQLPPWINQAAQQNYGFAQNVAEQPLQQYQGQMVADVAPQTQQSWNTAASGANAGQDQYNASQAGFLGVLGQAPQQVGAPSQQSLQGFMNPYTQSVINATLPIMQQQNALNQNQIGNQANAANAFGGSRQGIQQGVAQAQGAQNIGQMAAQLNQRQFRPGDAEQHGRAAGQPDRPIQPGQPQSTGGEWPRLARQPGAGERSQELLHAADGRRAAAGAGAEPDQRPDRQVPERRQLSQPAAFGPAERAWHDALRAGDAGVLDPGDAAVRQPACGGDERRADPGQPVCGPGYRGDERHGGTIGMFRRCPTAA